MIGKSKASGHRCAAQDDRIAAPIISIDYAFPGIKNGNTKEEDLELEEEATKAGRTSHLIMLGAESKGIYAHVARQKGACKHLRRRVVDDLDNIGYKEVVLKETRNQPSTPLWRSSRRVGMGMLRWRTPQSGTANATELWSPPSRHGKGRCEPRRMHWIPD